MLKEMTDTQTLTFTQVVKGSPANVYRAFTNGMSLREWLADTSQVDARENGTIFLAWNGGYFAAGRFTTLKPDEKIIFTWQGDGEPAATQAEVTLEKQGENTLITLEHSGIGQGGAWNGSAEQFQKNWTA